MVEDAQMHGHKYYKSITRGVQSDCRDEREEDNDGGCFEQVSFAKLVNLTSQNFVKVDKMR